MHRVSILGSGPVLERRKKEEEGEKINRRIEAAAAERAEGAVLSDPSSSRHR